jgi:hypothetical protein
MHQSTHFSALSSAILLLAKGIDSYGHDSAELFSKAGLDHSRLKGSACTFFFPGGDPAVGAHTISHSVAQFLERQGVLERDAKNSYLQMDDLKNIPCYKSPFC